jgi:hypothetical protein
MILSFIFSIFSVTFTLTSTTEVEPSGMLPNFSTYEYERSATTGQKGQMTAGNTTRLELNGWDGYIIRSVELQMRSNTKSGRGFLNMTVGKDVVWSIDDQEFCQDAWAGTYTTQWVPITQHMNVLVNNEPIEIFISATENSLYIQSYTIYYEKAYHTIMPDMPSIPSVSLESKAYTVYFNTGCDTSPSPITQDSPGTPIVLPAWRDTLSWYFMGWSEAEVVDSKLHTPILQPGQIYMPTRNAKLWAVYSDINEHVVTSDYVSGKYVIARYNDATVYYGGSGLAAYGPIDSEYINVTILEMSQNQEGIYCMESSYNTDMIYQLEFNQEDSSVLITHFKTGKPIGYNENKLCALDVAWKYRVLDDNSIIFYYPNTSNNQSNANVLYFGSPNGKECVFSCPLLLKEGSKNGLWLFPIIEEHFTSRPLGIQSSIHDIDRPIESINAVYHFGIYELRISNGKKSLIIK